MATRDDKAPFGEMKICVILLRANLTGDVFVEMYVAGVEIICPFSTIARKIILNSLFRI